MNWLRMFLICERQLRDLNNVAVTRWTVDPSNGAINTTLTVS